MQRPYGDGDAPQDGLMIGDLKQQNSDICSERLGCILVEELQGAILVVGDEIGRLGGLPHSRWLRNAGDMLDNPEAVRRRGPIRIRRVAVAIALPPCSLASATSRPCLVAFDAAVPAT